MPKSAANGRRFRGERDRRPMVTDKPKTKSKKKKE